MRKTSADAQMVTADSFAPIMAQLLEERDLGMLLCCVTLLLGICARCGSGEGLLWAACYKHRLQTTRMVCTGCLVLLCRTCHSKGGASILVMVWHCPHAVGPVVLQVSVYQPCCMQRATSSAKASCCGCWSGWCTCGRSHLTTPTTGSQAHGCRCAGGSMMQQSAPSGSLTLDVES